MKTLTCYLQGTPGLPGLPSPKSHALRPPTVSVRKGDKGEKGDAGTAENQVAEKGGILYDATIGYCNVYIICYHSDNMTIFIGK